MGLFDSIVDPTDLTAVRRVIAAGPNPGRLVSLDLDHLIISDNSSEETVSVIESVLGKANVDLSSAKVATLFDSTIIYRNGEDLKKTTIKIISEKFQVLEALLPGEHVYVDQSTIDLAVKLTKDADVIVSIGGGTVSDIGKLAAVANDSLLVSLQTAASVDGYTDNVSVLLKDGAKRTVPSTWPKAVIADNTVIKDAPIELNTSGFGEMLSLFTAPADWWLANQLGFDDSFHQTPRDLLVTFAGDPSIWGRGLSDGNPEATEQLTKVLAIRGIGTGIAGTTACLSGVEHLISHMLDMRAVSSHENVGLHGAQVGVGSLVAAEAWNYLLEKLSEFDALSEISQEQLNSSIKNVFDALDPSGKLAEECWSDCSKKLSKWNANQSRIESTLLGWKENISELRDISPSAELIATSLVVSGSPSEIGDLESWIDDSVWAWAVGNCHLMRNRFTVVDLLFFLGFWEEVDQREVIERAKQRVVVRHG